MSGPRARLAPGDRVARGREAEQLAADDLVARGFRVLWRNVRIGPLEVDVVAKKDDLVVIVEVRSRAEGALEGPLASLSISKRRALLKASRGIWRGRLSKMPEVMRVRIDVASVTYPREGAPRLEWVPGAITEDDG